MDTVINALRQVLGNPNFYKQMGSSSSYSWEYGAMIEYLVGALLVLIVVSSVFKFVLRLTK